MTHSEMVTLIRNGVPEPGGIWADVGAGSGNFTWALADLLGRHGTIYAIDNAPQALRQQRRRLHEDPPHATIHPIRGDLTQPLGLTLLDGILAANSLHFQRSQQDVLHHLASHLHSNGRLLVVEYDLAHSRPWVPYPLPWSALPALAERARLAAPVRVGTRRSPSGGAPLYAAVVTLV